MLLRLSKILQRKKEKKLAGQLLFYILLFSSFFTILAAVVQLWVDYHKDLGLIEKRILQVRQSYIGSLSLSIWNMNTDHVYAQLNGILQLPEIACLKAQTIDDVYKVGILPPEWRRISVKFPIIYEDPHQQFDSEQVGILTIYGDLGYIHSRLKERILVILTTQTIKTFSVSIFILFIVWSLITRHLLIMADYARKMNIDNLDFPLKLTPKRNSGKKNELFMVAEAINDMRKNLKHANDRLMQHRDQLEMKVAQRTNMLESQTVELREAKEKAEAANRAKSNFLSNMSHEIRTPMNAILGFTEILAAQEDDPQKIKYFKAVESNGQVLMKLLNDILDLSRIEAGKMKPEYAPVSLESLMNDVKTLFQNKIQEKKLAFFVDIPTGIPPFVLLDGLRIRQVLINLMGNAVKFTSKGFIRLSITFSNQAPFNNEYHQSLIDLSFSVEDSGIGIPRNQLETVFESFAQIKGQTHSDHGGTGLGLSISRRLMEMMNGSISVESIENKGTTFHIYLNDVEIAPDIEAADTITENGLAGENIGFEGSTLLIVDDIDYNRELLKGFVKNWDLSFIEAENGREAIEKCKTDHPDLILLDMKMPVMDGYSAAEILKHHPELHHIPIVAVTASAMTADQDRINRLCDAYLPKPFRKSDLLTTLMKFLPYSQKEKPFQKNQTIDTTKKRNALDDKKAQIEPAAKKIKNILFVDDDPNLVEIGRLFLEPQGYHVMTATGGKEAVSLFTEAPEGVDLLVTDLSMPEMSGIELIKTLREIQSDLLVILSTGFLVKSSRELDEDIVIDGFLTKPIMKKKLIDAIKAIEFKTIS